MIKEVIGQLVIGSTSLSLWVEVRPMVLGLCGTIVEGDFDCGEQGLACWVLGES